MSLLWQLLSEVLRVAFRAGVLVAILFGGHLLLTAALPQVQRVAEALERAPRLEQELAELSTSLADQGHKAAALRSELSSLTQKQLLLLQARAVDAKHRLDDLESQRESLVASLEELRAETEEHCTSFNPIKRLVCYRFEARLEKLTLRVQPLLDALSQEVETARALWARADDQVRLLSDPEIDDATKLELLGVPKASSAMLRLADEANRIAETQRRISELEEALAALNALRASRLAWLLSEWQAVRLPLLLVALGLLVLPYAQRTLNYFVLMPTLVKLSPPLRLATSVGGRLLVGRAERSLPLTLQAGQFLQVRSEYARPVQGKTEGRLLYRWWAPFISYAAGLWLLTRVHGASDGVAVTLAAPADVDGYLMRLDLDGHPGIVIHPRYVVGVIGEPQLSTKWRLGNIHAWCTLQLRYILFSGTGSVIIRGHGDIVASLAQKPTKIEQQLVVGFDARLDYATRRTEVFLPYLIGKTPLVDDLFSGKPGQYFFWQKAPAAAHRSPVARTFDVLFSAVGKVLGF